MFDFPGGEELEDIEDGDVPAVIGQAVAGVVEIEGQGGVAAGGRGLAGFFDFPLIVVERVDGRGEAVVAEVEGEDAEAAAEVEERERGAAEFGEDGGVERVAAEL